MLSIISKVSINKNAEEKKMPVKRLRNGEKIIGTMIRIVRNPAVVLVAQQAGLDFFMIDMEHGSFSYNDLADMCTAAHAAQTGCFVRVPELSRGHVSRSFDCGANGVMVPMIESVEQAELFASWAKYKPLGKRGLGSAGGNTGYSRIQNASNYMKNANLETIAIAQIESVDGVEAADGIAAVDGIDVLLVGPFDLSVSLGVPGNFTAPEMNEAIKRVAESARKHNKVFGMHAGAPLLETWIPHGMRLIMYSIDIGMISAGMQDVKDWFDNNAR